MTLTNETLMAFVDGELSPSEMSRVEAELRNAPALAAYVEQQRALRHDISASLEAIIDEPIPAALRDAVWNTPVSWQWRLSRALRTAFSPRGLIWTGVPAAALACGVAIGVILSGNTNALMGVRGGALIARGALAHALDQQLASAQSGHGPQIGISFRDRNNHYCRTFTSARLAGVACREDSGWNIAALSEHAREPQGTYATAASAMPDLVRQAVSGMIAGAPLDAAGEARARDEGWKAQ